MLHYLQRQRRFLLLFCIGFSLANPLASDGITHEMPFTSLSATSRGLRAAPSLPHPDGHHASHCIQISIVLKLRKSTQFGNSSRTDLRRVLGDIVGVGSKDVLILSVETISPQNHEPEQQRRKENGQRQAKGQKQQSCKDEQNSMLSGPKTWENGSSHLCQEANGEIELGAEAMSNGKKLNVSSAGSMANLFPQLGTNELSVCTMCCMMAENACLWHAC